jgi:hypothetical protein
MAPTLTSLGLKIKRHWKQYRPKMYADLVRADRLDEAVYAAEQAALNSEATLLRQGLNPDQVRELTREEWAFPSEEDVPELGSDPCTDEPG